MNWDYLRQSLWRRTPGEMAARYALRGVNRAVELALFHGLCLTTTSAREPGPLLPGLETGFVDPSRLFAEAKDPGSGLTVEGVRHCLAADEQCYGAMLDGRLVSHLWFSRHAAHLQSDVFVGFDRAYAYSRWAFTRTEHRGRRLHALTKFRALAELSKQGRRGILSVVSAVNFESLQAAKRLGCERAGVLLITRAAGKRVLWTSPACRRYGLWLESLVVPSSRA